MVKNIKLKTNNNKIKNMKFKLNDSIAAKEFQEYIKKKK